MQVYLYFWKQHFHLKVPRPTITYLSDELHNSLGYNGFLLLKDNYWTCRLNYNGTIKGT